MYTLENCVREWEETGRHGPVEERLRRTRRWLPYYAYLARDAREKDSPPEAQPSGPVAYLLREGLVDRETSVLDIGAGTGSYALELAGYCGSVTALEPCSDCLETLRSRAGQRGLDNITTVESTWEEFHPPGQYDLTFSALCPAICNVEELRRMEAMSRRACCLVAVMRGSYDKHRRAMMEGLGVRPQGGMATEALHYFNALYLMGRRPNVRCITRDFTSRIPVERAMERYTVYFRIFGVPEERSRQFLEGYLAEHAGGGWLEEHSHMKLAVLCWGVCS